MNISLRAHNLLGCRGVTRSDFKFFNNKFYPSPDGSLVFSEEQQAELDTLFGERDQLRKDLRKVRYDLNADIDGLGQRLQLLNVLVLPGLVLVVGLVLVLGRGARRKAA